MAYERSIYSDMYSPNNMFGVGNTAAANNLNTQTAFRPNTFLDNRIKMMQGMEDQGYAQPNLPKLKQRDWDQFQKKQIPLSLPRDQYKGVEGWKANAGNIMNDANILQPDFSKVNKAGMIPEGFIDKMKSLYGGITNTDAAQTMNTGNKYANLADDAWANKQTIRTPGGEIVVDTESGQVAPDIAGFPRDEIQETVRDQWTLPQTDWGPVRPTEPLPERGKIDMFLQKFGVPPMTQVSPEDRAGNEQFMGQQGIGIDPQGRMYGGNWNEASQDFAGKIAPGKSGWGSANFGEMAQKWDEEYGDMDYRTLKMQRKQQRMKQRAAEFAVQQQAQQQERIRNERAQASAANQMTQRQPGMGGAHMSRSVDKGGLGITAEQAQAVSDANAAAGMGGWNLAYGGRVGYNQGGRVGILAAF